MRVLQVVSDNDRRGAQIFATHLHAGLADLGCEVETVALAPGQVGGLDIPTLLTDRYLPATIRALRRKARDADVVVAHGARSLPVTALATLGLSRPFVYRQISDSLYWAPTRARRARVRAGLSRAARIVALWDGEARTLVEHFRVPADKLRVIPNGVRGSDWWPPSPGERATAKRELGLPVDLPVVALVGALSREKGPDRGVVAVAATPEAHLLVVGAGPEEARTRELAEKLIRNRVTFLGSAHSMWDVYAATDVLLVPSRSECMPAVVIEAGLMGVPTVATDVGALGEMIRGGETGELVSVADAGCLAAAVQSLLRDEERRVAQGVGARADFLRRYDLKPVARQWMRTLTDCASEHTRSAQ